MATLMDSLLSPRNAIRSSNLVPSFPRTHANTLVLGEIASQSSFSDVSSSCTSSDFDDLLDESWIREEWDIRPSERRRKSPPAEVDRVEERPSPARRARQPTKEEDLRRDASQSTMHRRHRHRPPSSPALRDVDSSSTSQTLRRGARGRRSARASVYASLLSRANKHIDDAALVTNEAVGGSTTIDSHHLHRNPSKIIWFFGDPESLQYAAAARTSKTKQRERSVQDEPPRSDTNSHLPHEDAMVLSDAIRLDRGEMESDIINDDVDDDVPPPLSFDLSFETTLRNAPSRLGGAEGASTIDLADVPNSPRFAKISSFRTKDISTFKQRKNSERENAEATIVSAKELRLTRESKRKKSSWKRKITSPRNRNASRAQRRTPTTIRPATDRRRRNQTEGKSVSSTMRHSTSALLVRRSSRRERKQAEDAS